MLDLKFAFRQLFKNPGFTAVAVLTLALGIGASTAMFSVVDSVLLRPMPYPESDRLVVLEEDKLPDLTDFAVAPGNFIAWREQATVFENLAADLTGNFNLTGTGDPLRLNVRFLTANYLTTFGVRPLLGRDFRAEDESPRGGKVVLLSHAFWQKQLGGATDVTQQTLRLDGEVYEIIGVVPAGFLPGSTTDLYVPAVFQSAARQNHGAHYLNVAGRLRPGVTLDQARQELSLICARLGDEFPITNKGWGARLTPLLGHAVGSSSPLLLSLLGAVGFLLLIACANVANLTLVRATARTRELAVRSALGASRGRIIRQLLGESLLLSALGGVLGLFVALWGMKALVALAPGGLPRLAEISMDGRAFLMALGLAVITGVAFGLIPATHATRLDPGDSLKAGGRAVSAGARGRGLMGALVVTEVAVALVLLAGAGVLVRSFTRLQSVNPGFDPENAVAVTLSLANKDYQTDAQKSQFVERVTTALATIPSVKHVGTTAVLPFSGDDFNLRFNVAGRPPVDPAIRQSTLYYPVTPGYFSAMGIRLLRGRAFDTRDIAGSPRVAIINERLAKRYFPNEDPIGQRINLSNGPESFREIVGIVTDVKHYRLNDEGELKLQTYEPFAQQPYDFMTFVVRTGTRRHDLAAMIGVAVRSVDSSQPIARVRPLDDLLSDSVARQRFSMTIFMVFSLAALLLAALGIYGVTAFTVMQRTGEIGVRKALGAQRSQVLGLVFRQSSRIVAFGLAAGMLGALLLTRFLAALLFGVSPQDPLTFAGTLAILTLVAALACLLPALRAARVSPMAALRAQ